MHSAFRLQKPKRIVAVDLDRRTLEPSLVARLHVYDIRRKPLAFAISKHHPEYHPRPVVALSPSGTRVDGHDRIATVVRTA